MGASPGWKVFTARGEYEAACKSAETAAAVVSMLGEGATIRAGHAKRLTVWTEGADADGIAADSYDETAEVCCARAEEMGRLSW